jgi:hypothetical protein
LLEVLKNGAIIEETSCLCGPATPHLGIYFRKQGTQKNKNKNWQSGSSGRVPA